MVGVKGRTVVLPCSASHPQSPGCWEHNYSMEILCWDEGDFHPIDQFRGRVKLLNKNSLELSKLSVSDTGTYGCYTYIFTYGEQVKLIVRDVPVSKPSITQNPDGERVNQGTSVTLTCHSENGSWPILYSWSRLDRGTGKNISLWASNNTLSFDYARPEDSGEYRCVASNQVEGRTWSHSATFRLSVHNVPAVDVPAPHPMVWVTLALSGCAVLIAVLSWRRRTHTHTLERGQTELQAMPTSSKPSRIHETSNHQQSTGQDDVYCPLSGNRNEELYDTLN
ncbi:hypothetical protein SKAU_G00420570 [Synaphobranchus kaupii]|uniref:Ig-like domain-containing protein n=1 Tax=Synaphobranchus kaupii TaxID=118154 RepID=A0A9Q1E6K6_SYNKA|nr:hypothetical protein SKAU_G00420570 [Synaphobranchus kaupii]